MTRRFLRWWVTWAMVGALVAALAYVAVGGRLETAASPPQTATGPQTASEWRGSPVDGTGRVLEPRIEQAPVGGGGAFSAPVADRPLLPGPLSKTKVVLGVLRPAGPAADPPLAVGPVCSSPCAVDVSEWDVPTPEPVAVNGIASHMGRGFPSWYLALPQGPGFIARICGPGGCVTRTSTDAGPSKAMQRYPYYRVADLSVSDFEKVCGCSASMGLVPVSVALIGRAR